MDRWDEVMTLAKEYGFVEWAYGGLAILMTEKVREELRQKEGQNE